MIIKMSYTILNNWMQGRYEEAVANYLGKPIVSSPAMQLGKLKHEIWQRYIDENKSLPLELGGGKLRDPLTERKYEKLIPLGKYDILFRGVIDLEHTEKGVILEDFKCGLSESGTYLNGWQLDAYKLLRPDAVEGRYRCFNPYTDTYTVGVKYLSEANAEKALENIITFGSELIQYLESQKLLIDYKETINV